MPKRALLVLLACGLSMQAVPPDSGEILKAHNLYRSRVGSPPLVWSGKLAASAQQWAALLIKREAYAPRRNGQFGENLFEITGGTADAHDVVDAWAGEAKNFNPKKNSCSSRCGHYTQVIWRDTKSIGCGMARGKDREVWVCNYDPPGNVVGERPY